MRALMLMLTILLPAPLFGAVATAADAAGQMQPVFESARIEVHPSTGAARLLVFDEAERPELGTDKSVGRAAQALRRFGSLFGVSDPAAELRVLDTTTDRLGRSRTSFEQLHRGVPVIGGVLRVHVDAEGRLHAINGTFIPTRALDTNPRVAPEDAAQGAFQLVAKGSDPFDHAWLDTSDPVLAIYHSGLTKGQPGTPHLVWQTEVADGQAIRKLVLIDAHSGAVIETLDLVHTLHRSIHSGNLGNRVWDEGDPLPFSGSSTAQTNEVNELISTSADVFNFFANLSGNTFRSWDGQDGTMHSVENLIYDECPNAFWNGQSTNFCRGMVSDDVAAHEWAHAFTGSTHSLVYQWQPGALNEAYSDIFGEAVDLLNNRGSDSPNTPRVPGSCSVVGGSSPSEVEVLDPPELAGPMDAGGAVFNPLPPWNVTGQAELVDDGLGNGSDACQSLDDFTPGRVAVIRRGDCTFVEKVTHAWTAGAIAVIVVNNQGNGVITMGGDSGRLAIPAVLIGQDNGEAIIAALEQGVDVRLSQVGATDQSLRWLIGEDTQGGAIRDMWRPECFDDPARVSSGYYVCNDSDNGGVHTNSGVPNRAFALAVDGGESNGYSVQGIGLTRAAHIWWRAMSVYQVPTTEFTDHADLIGLACADLIGNVLPDPATGNPSADVITADTCLQVEKAMQAVEMRQAPTQCGFEPLLSPDVSEIGIGQLVFSEEFDSDPTSGEGGWQISNAGVYAEYDPRDWVWTDNEPPGGFGDGAAFALDSVFIGNCFPGSDDQSGVMHLDSPPITLPAGAADAVLVVDHYVATEAGWDGGTISISVNGGTYQPVHVAHFLQNRYNSVLESTGNPNPLAGQWAFTGTNSGALSGSWGQSQVALRTFAGDGDSIRIRFSFGVDGCNGVDGWYLDRVRVIIEGEGPRGPDGRAGG